VLEPQRILIVDDEEQVCTTLSGFLINEGSEITTCGTAEDTLREFKIGLPDVIIADHGLPGMTGTELAARVHTEYPDVPVIILTGLDCCDLAVKAMKSGAYDFVLKPAGLDELLLKVQDALLYRHQQLSICQKSSPTATPPPFSDGASPFSIADYLFTLMGKSPVIRDLVAEVEIAAACDVPVLITGETGSGKELVALAIYRGSKRSRQPFVVVDCGGIPASLIESELFGSEKGAFTSATSSRQGFFEQADKGTILFDEFIPGFRLDNQKSLLRVIETKRFHPAGGGRERCSDFRALFATNLNVEDEVKKGNFKHDLFFRIDRFRIGVPPLRERRDDIPFLISREIKRANLQFNKNVDIDPTALQILVEYDWPGNVREMQNVAVRAVVTAQSRITPEHLTLSLMAGCPDAGPMSGFGEQRPLNELVKEKKEEIERIAIIEALRSNGGNKSNAARELGICRKTLITKVASLGITHYDILKPSGKEFIHPSE